jgi:uncharacterized membrane protein
VEDGGVGQRWDTARTEAFSDGVFAIAITLLVLDIRIPLSEFSNLWLGIVREWPAYLAYVTSFTTIGGIWLAHHGMFGRLRSVDGRLMRVNLLLLMAVSFLPFPTRLVAEAIRSTNAERAAVVFYGLSLLLVASLIGALWSAAARRRDLIEPGVSDEEVNAVLRAATPSLGLYAVAIAVAVALPRLAAVGYLLIGLLLVLRARGDRPASTPGPTRG